MIVEVKAQSSAPSPPYGSIQIRLFRALPWPEDRPDARFEVAWLFPTFWVR